ncbi:MAG: transglutaminase [Rubrivivax sp.]|nr:MAG: transglutaminase [Rubrivivax sp.]
MSSPLQWTVPSALDYFSTLVAEDDTLNLAEAATAIALDDVPRLDVQQVMAELDRLGERLRHRLPADAPPSHRLRMLNQYFHGELGFAGNVNDYYAVGNSYLHQVLATRRGIPISLAIIYMELASHVGLRVKGVSFPGHFLMKLSLPQGEVVLDPFSGRSLGRGELDEFLSPWRERAGLMPEEPMSLDAFLGTAPPRQILARMLRNLKQIHMDQADLPRLLAVQRKLVALLPGDRVERVELEQCLQQLRDAGGGPATLH